MTDNELFEICSKYGYDYEILPAVLDCAADILRLISDELYKKINRKGVKLC